MSSQRAPPPGARRSPWGLFRCEETTDDEGQVKSQRFFYDAAPPEHPGIGIVRPTSSQRLRFGDFGRRLAPSGEVLAWLVAKGSWNLAGKRVLELGSGLGLPGMACAAWTGCESVLLSDGDPELVEVLQANVALNQQAGAFGGAAPDAASGRHVQATFLDWVQGGNVEEGSFDVILCADCVYDVELHIPLLMTLRRYLRPDGKVMLIASPRGGSLNVFLHAARGFFGSVTCTVDYDEAVSSKFRGQNCFPQLVTLETLDCNRVEMEDFSVLEDEHAKRFVERRRRALQAEEEQMKLCRCRFGVRPALRTTALSNNELNSMIERMMNPRIRGARRPGAGVGEGDEQAPGNATDDLYLPRSQAVQPAAQISRPSTGGSVRPSTGGSLRPSTGGSVRGRTAQGNRDPDSIRALRETVQEALLEQKNKSRNITSPESGESVSEQKPHPEDKLEYQSSRLMQPIHRGRIYYKCDDQEESNTTAAFYKHLQDKPQRPINPSWVMTNGFRSRAVGRARIARGLSGIANSKRNIDITVKITPAWQTIYLAEGTRQQTAFFQEQKAMEDPKRRLQSTETEGSNELEIANRLRGMGSPGGARQDAGARVTNAAEGSNDSGEHLATRKADALRPVLQQAVPSSVQSCPSNPFDGIRNGGLGATWGEQLGSERRGNGQPANAVTPVSYSRRLTKSFTQVVRQESASFITVKELTQKMKHTSWCTREGEDLRRLLNSIRTLGRS